MVAGGRYHNLKDMGGLINPTGKKLTYDTWPSIPHPGFDTHRSIFETDSRKRTVAALCLIILTIIFFAFLMKLLLILR